MTRRWRRSSCDGASTSTPGDVSGTVPATLALTLGTPGDASARSCRASPPTTQATMTATGHLDRRGRDAERARRRANTPPAGWSTARTRSQQPLQVSANSGAFAPLRTDNGPLDAADLERRRSARSNVTLGFKQSIGATEGLRTGAYAKTLTFTLSTTTP